MKPRSASAAPTKRYSDFEPSCHEPPYQKTTTGRSGRVADWATWAALGASGTYTSSFGRLSLPYAMSVVRWYGPNDAGTFAIRNEMLVHAALEAASVRIPARAISLRMVSIEGTPSVGWPHQLR